jgi:tight adherence protein B
MVGPALYVILLGAVVVVLLLVYSFGGNTGEWIKRIGKSYQDGIEKADLTIKAEEFVFTLIGSSLIVWLIVVFLLRPTVLIGFLLLPICVCTALIAGSLFLNGLAAKRLGSFVNQLEMVLRMMAGALRVGLGLRQSMILVAEEMPDPARREFQRIIGRTNIGMSINDSLDELARSLPAPEVVMMSRSIRVQAQTGGDLAHVLETLASTIKDRRRIFRKMGALTAQGRFGAGIIGALPLLVGGFVMLTQPDLADPLLHTQGGWVTLGLVFVLEGFSIFSLSRILQFDV